MAKYEITTDLLIHCRIIVEVEADSKEEAVDAASEILPQSYDPDAAKAWRAKVDLKPPKGVKARVTRAYHFEQASGAEKARKIGARP